MINENLINEIEQKQIIDQCAEILRRESKNVGVTKLDYDNIIAEVLIEGELTSIPWQIKRFYWRSFTKKNIKQIVPVMLLDYVTPSLKIIFS